MTGEQRTSRPRRLLATAAVGALALGGAVGLGACRASTAGAACTGDETGLHRGTVLHCVNGQFVAGETVMDFIRSLLNELRARQGDGSTTTTEVGSEHPPGSEVEHPDGPEVEHPERGHHDTTTTVLPPA